MQLQKSNLSGIILLLIWIVLAYSCNSLFVGANLNDLEDIIVITQCDGVYEYSGDKLNKKLKFKIEASDVYIERPLDYENNEIIIGFRYKSEEVDSISYYSKYYTLDKVARKTIKYIEVESFKVIAVEKENFRSGEIKIDTFYNCTGSSSSTRYLKYRCINKKEDFERFYSESISESGDKVYSRKGNIYYETSEGLIQITDFKGEFYPKFGSGFYSPKFIKGNKSILYGEITGFLSNETPSLYEYDIETRKTTKFIDGEFFDRKISKNGRHMLFSRASREDYKVDLDCRNYSIFVMNLTTKEIVELGRGSYYEWKK